MKTESLLRKAGVGFIAVTCILVNTLSAAINNSGHKGVVRTFSAQSFDYGKMNLLFSFYYAQDRDYVIEAFDRDADTALTINESPKTFSGNLAACFSFSRYLDLSASLPFYYDWAGFDGVEDHGFGDAVLALKFLYPSGYEDPVFTQAYLLRATLPTGMKNHGVFPRNPYYYHSKTFYSTDLPNVNPMLLWTVDLRRGKKVSLPLVFNMNIGAVFTVDTERNNTLNLNCSVEYMPFDPIKVFLDFSAESRWENFGRNFDMLRDPVMLSPGFSIESPGGLVFKLAGDFSLAFDDERTFTTDKYTYTTTVAPVYGFQLQIGWNGYVLEIDKDGDGIRNSDDGCPDEAEDFDGFEDDDGCPDPDNDEDGVCDPWVTEQGLGDKYADICKGVDQCPGEPEDIDGFEDDDGCPDPDNDGDGIPDSLDKCPEEAEDYDGIEDEDGCPDHDNDDDGISDSEDECPNQPEDYDGYQDKDGCPDPDNDGDGVPDILDRCPMTPGSVDNDGCPVEDSSKDTSSEPEFPRKQILKGVKFGSGEYTISEGSKKYIDPVIEKLKENKEIEIEVRGHTDRIGSFEANIRLSEKRAQSVRDYMVDQGVDPDRITAVGFGPKSPIGDNRTAKGRAMNRRIEIIRLK